MMMKNKIINKEKKERKEKVIFWISMVIIILCLIITFSFIGILEKDKTEDKEKTGGGFLNTLYNFWGGFLEILGIAGGGEECFSDVHITPESIIPLPQEIIWLSCDEIVLNNSWVIYADLSNEYEN